MNGKNDTSKRDEAKADQGVLAKMEKVAKDGATEEMIIDTIERQKQYVEKQKETPRAWGWSSRTPSFAACATSVTRIRRGPCPSNSTTKKKWEIELLAVREGPFYRRLGEQKRIVINTEHPFYSTIYIRAGEAKHALEVMLFVLAERELDSNGDAETFYKSECQKWSDPLRHALDVLLTDESLQDKVSALAETLHASV